MNVWFKRSLWGFAVLLALWMLAWLAVPPLLKWQAEKQLSEVLGRSVGIGKVEFHPWALELVVNDLVIAGATPAKADEPVLKLARLRADLSASSLLRRAPVIEALELDALQLRLARTAPGHYDIDDLLARFAPRPDARPSEPLQFALYNLQLRDATLRFDDRPLGRVHTVDALQLTLPFLSNLPAQVDVKVEPRLAFRLNGAAFDSGAQATPFAQTRAGDLKLVMTDLDLSNYVVYLPAALPVRLARGSVSADLMLQFTAPAGAAPSVALRGTIEAHDFALNDPSGATLLAWKQLRLGLRDVQPLVRKLGFDTLRIEALQVHAGRDAAGRINLLTLTGEPAAASGTAAASMPASIASTPVRADAAAPWQVSLSTLELADARVLWNDAGLKPAVALQLDGIGLKVEGLQWPVQQPMPVSLVATLRAQGDGAPLVLGSLGIDGPVTDHDAKLSLKLDGLALEALAPYLAASFSPRVEGRLSAQATLDWSDQAGAPRMQLGLASATLDGLRVRDGGERGSRGGADAVAIKQLELADVQLDLRGRSVVLGSVKLLQPALALARERDGRLNLQRWLVAPAPSASAPARAASAGHAAEPAWRVQLKDLQLEGGQLRVADALARAGAATDAEPLRFEVSKLRIGVQGLQWQGERSLPPARVQLAARIGTAATPRAAAALGDVDWKGQLGVEPLSANGTLRIERFPVQLFEPYFADRVALRIVRAEAGYNGKLALRLLPAGPDVSLAGDVLLGSVNVNAAGSGDELLSWQSLKLGGVKFVMQPGGRPRLEVAEAALDDFYSRLVITEQGRFNLQDVAAAPAGAASAASAPAEAAASAAPVVATAASAAQSALPLDIQVGATRLTNGKVDFSDRFVKPNYSAALTELNGQLGPFRSDSREMATLALRGRAAGTALLEISGQLNPTVRPLALDIKAKASDLELAPLSPYAGKYAGYAIERGKLSMEVSYKIDAEGKLDAKNQVILNQLTFGDKIASPDATKLPVLLAVALLKDRNGVIDINLPVSGSLNDPQFSIGGIIWKIILNLLTKALTAPFALLAGGGSDDLSLVEFKPGTPAINAAGGSAIDKVAKALTERPALKMTVTGAADPASEREAFLSVALEARLATEARREALRSGAAATAASAASAAPALADEDRRRLLKQVYKETEIPNKPRTALGFAKDIPGPEMEALLKSRIAFSEEAMRELALQRGIAVRDALIAKGLPSERLFLAAPKLRASGEGATTWTPRVQLSLSAN